MILYNKIDLKDPKIVALFGENAGQLLAAIFGYQAEVPKTADELPEKISVTVTNEQDGTEEEVLQYPEGTVFTKPNPEKMEDFISRMAFSTITGPAIAKMIQDRKRAEVAKQAAAEEKAIAQVFADVAQTGSE